jgi:hypothetical protein
MTGRPSKPVRALTTWPMAESSDTMYKKRVTRVMKLRYNMVSVP